MHNLIEVSQPYTKEAAATQLGTSVATINRLISAGKIDSLKVGRNVRIEPKAIEAFKNSQQQKQANG